MILRNQEAWGIEQFRQGPAKAWTLNVFADFRGVVLD